MKPEIMPEPAAFERLRAFPDFLHVLRCPRTGSQLVATPNGLIDASGSHVYEISRSGIVLFEPKPATADAAVQQAHYDNVANAYIANLGYPHTQVYNAYLDCALDEVLEGCNLGRVAEICCGNGEGLKLIKRPVGSGVGVDISQSMLENARSCMRSDRFLFVQGDATRLPLASDTFDTVLMNGGIHHVNDREKLFAEIYRILKPGGRFVFREPCNDFLPWRMIRSIIYRFSPALDHETERPVRFHDTMPPLAQLGFEDGYWRTYGFLGFCFFMNSDVLVVNRLFRFIPGIRTVTRAVVALDEATRRLPGMSERGLQAVGAVTKSVSRS